MTASGLANYLNWLIGEKIRSSKENLFQDRLIAAVIFVAMSTAFATGLPLIFLLRDPSGYVTFGFGLTMLLLLVVFRFGLSTTYSFIFLEIATGIHFLICRAMQDRIDWPLAVWLTIFPILRLLYGGFRHGLGGMMYSTLLAVCMYAIEFYSPFLQIPVSNLISFERGLSFTIAVFIITAVFNELRMEALKQAELAASARTLFLANMSHELRTPMNGVIGITELMLVGDISFDFRKKLELVHRSGIQMIALVNDILDLTRLESSKLKLEKVPTDIRRIISDIITLQKPNLDGKNLFLNIEIDESIPNACLSDPIRLKQVLTNLTCNAIKFTEKGAITIKVFTREQRIHFQVMDTGIGIPSSVHAKLFLPFEQADLTFTRRFGGSGLGLAISQRLVTLFGGKLLVNSVEGEGSVFSFDIDCIVSESIPTIPSPAQTEKYFHAGLRVLVVEDNEVNLLVAVKMLEHCGCSVDCKSNGEEALIAVSQNKYDLVLMDCHMPVMDGFEATRRMRKFPNDVGNIPIVALTASAMTEDVQACFLSGMNAVLTKPLTLIDLREMLQRIQSNHRIRN